MVVLDERFRRRMLARFDLGRRDGKLGPSISESTFVYVGYRRGIASERDRVERIASEQGMQTWSDAQVLAGESFESASTQAAHSADLMVALISSAGVRAGLRREINLFLSLGKPILPVLLGAGYEALPRELRGVRAIRLPAAPKDEDYSALFEGIKRLRERSATKRLPVDPEDPQKGQWGGLAERNGRRLSASVRAVAEDWFAIQLRVESTGDRGLYGPVVFHLHPTFSESVVKVEAVSGVASLRLEAYGAFTVGVEVDAGLTALELDLSLDDSLPIEFRRL